MCTAIQIPPALGAAPFFFGRTLDLEYHHREAVTLIPRACPMPRPDGDVLRTHPALLGMAYMAEGYPLFYDGMNEYGVCAAGLAFSGCCAYGAPDGGGFARRRLPPWALIPDVLLHCRTAEEAAERLRGTVLCDVPFIPSLQNQPMHWLIADRETAWAAEPDFAGVLRIIRNPLGVLTNAPPLDYQLDRQRDYAYLTPDAPTDAYTRGMGSAGLPGGWTSPARFAQAAYLRRTMRPQTPTAVFSMLDAVSVPRGAVRTEHGEEVVTVYAACMEPEAFAYHAVTEYSRTPLSVCPEIAERLGEEPFCVPIPDGSDEAACG